MNCYEIDPSLCAAERPPDSLADGFSPALTMTHTTPTHHPVEPEPYPPATDIPDNPTQLPIEPEFGQALPPAEPEEPGVPKPSI